MKNDEIVRLLSPPPRPKPSREPRRKPEHINRPKGRAYVPRKQPDPAKGLFPALLHSRRIEAGMSMQALAEAVGIKTGGIVSAIENGGRSPYPKIIDDLAAFFGDDPDVWYCAAGRVPPDIIERLAGDLTATKRVRMALDHPYHRTTEPGKEETSQEDFAHSSSHSFELDATE